jgi:hypothetical protein
MARKIASTEMECAWNLPVIQCQPIMLGTIIIRAGNRVIPLLYFHAFKYHLNYNVLLINRDRINEQM